MSTHTALHIDSEYDQAADDIDLVVKGFGGLVPFVTVNVIEGRDEVVLFFKGIDQVARFKRAFQAAADLLTNAGSTIGDVTTVHVPIVEPNPVLAEC